MNFPQHIQGAIVAGVAVGALAVVTGQVEPTMAELEEFVRNPMEEGGDLRRLLSAAFLAWFMGLFPDLDTGSTPQKYYFRIMFVFLIGLYIMGDLEILALVSIAGFAPMLHKHRGWTHWLITPWVFGFLIAVTHEYLRARDSWFWGFELENAFEWWTENWIYTAACVIGHYTHLLLDSRMMRRFKPEARAKEETRDKQAAPGRRAKKSS